MTGLQLLENVLQRELHDSRIARLVNLAKLPAIVSFARLGVNSLWPFRFLPLVGVTIRLSLQFQT